MPVGSELPRGAQRFQVIHSAVRGRARVHVQGLRQNANAVDALQLRLRHDRSIRHASASAITGNVLILFSPESPIEDVLRAVEVAFEAALRSEPFIAPSREVERIWAKEIHEVISALESSPSGLTSPDADARLARVGQNRLARATTRSAMSIALAQFQGLPVILLSGSAVLSLATGGLGDAFVISVVVIANAVIGGWAEHRAERTISALTRITHPPVETFRDGVVVRITPERLVPGDVIQLTRGESVPADARLMDVDEFMVDESPLTGESVPVRKSTARLDADNVPLAERSNMVFRGTAVSSGTARALIVATGSATEVGRVQSLVASAIRPPTPLERQLDALGRQLVIATGLASSAVAVIGLLRGTPPVEILRSALSLAVAAIPEGLPTVATTTLAAGTQRLREREVIVRRLDAIEACGALQILGLDKTGTITMNRMRVEAVVADGIERRRDVNGHFEPDAKCDALGGNLARLAQIAVLCSEATTRSAAGSLAVEGTSTEAALIHFAAEIGCDVVGTRARQTIVEQQSRSEDRMYMATLHEGEDGRRLVTVKGRPDQVLALCASALVEGRVVPLTADGRRSINAGEERLSSDGLRVLAFAYAEGTELALADLESEPILIWVGIVGLTDPLRPDIRRVIAQLRDAGIRPVMLTGDQSATARAIAQDIGLGHDGKLEVLDSTELQGVPPEVLRTLANKVDVFSRVSPLHKLEIVKALQQSGRVVGMTGDGINDGPALRAADVGIAMAREGDELAREVADVLLLNDRVVRLIDLIAEGRTIADDIEKSVQFVVSTNLSEVLLTIFATAGGFGLPLNARQLLWINVLTDVLPELALAMEAPTQDVLKRPPRPAKTPLVSSEAYRRLIVDALVMTAVSFADFARSARRDHSVGSTKAFLTLGASQLLHAIGARSESSVLEGRRLPPNHYLTEAVGGGLVVQVLAMIFPALRQLLGSRQVTLSDVGVSWGLGGVALAATEMFKLWRHHWAPRQIGQHAQAGSNN